MCVFNAESVKCIIFYTTTEDLVAETVGYEQWF